MSSETSFDFLSVSLNGFEIDAISGEVDWNQVTVGLEHGPQVVEWRYEKDGSVFEGQDTGWIDLITLEGYAGWYHADGPPLLGNTAFDLDRDGANQFFEYATGGSRLAYDRDLPPQLVNGSLEWIVPKPNGVRDAHFDAEVSSDLIEWTRQERSILQDDESVFRARDDRGPARRPSVSFAARCTRRGRTRAEMAI